MKKDYKAHSKKFRLMFDSWRVSENIGSHNLAFKPTQGVNSESESSTFSLLYLFLDFISVSGVARVDEIGQGCW